MKASKNLLYPSVFKRILFVAYRHFRVYSRHFISNALPPFFEPLIFLVGIGLGVGKYIASLQGLIVSSAMFTASFECTYGTFIRLEFDKVYDGILSAPISPANLILGEILWAGAMKGFFFSFAVLVILLSFGIFNHFLVLLTPFIGSLTGLLFSSFALFITSFVKNINYYNFFFTGFLSPMFFLSGIFFPIKDLPFGLVILSDIMPLSHLVRLARSLCFQDINYFLWTDLFYVLGFILLFTILAIRNLSKRLID